MTNGKDRLDRIENDLETVKDILIAVARRAESTDERLERLAQRTDERINRLAEQQERTQQNLDQLSEDVDIAFFDNYSAFQ